MVTAQVRYPVGAMPMFPANVLSDGDLGKIIEFILGLDGAHAHIPSEDITQEVALHHWMALLALQFDDIPDAIHHVEHINELVTGEHLHQMEEVLSSLEEGHNHDATRCASHERGGLDANRLAQGAGSKAESAGDGEANWLF